MDKELEKGIDIYINHIRRMAKLTDQQMEMLMIHNSDKISLECNQNKIDVIEKQIKHVRQMQNLTDDQIKDILLKNNMHEILREGAIKRNLKEIANAAKDIRGDPRKFARKVDIL